MVRADPTFERLPQALSAQEVMAIIDGVPVQRATAGPLTIEVKVDETLGEAVVTVMLAEVELAKRLLSYTEPELDLNLARGGASATGNIALQLAAEPQFSCIHADVSASEGGQVTPFKGNIASWQALGPPVVGHYCTQLDADFDTYTTVRGFAASTANFEFRQAGKAIAAMTATQFAPVQIQRDPVVAGNLHINPGAQITLAVPTEFGPGMLFLQCCFGTVTTPPTQVSSSVANIVWPKVAPSVLIDNSGGMESFLG